MKYEPSIQIRRAVADDAAAIAEIYNEAVLSTTATFDTVPKSAEDRRQWLADHDDRHPVLVAECEGAVAGWAALTRWSDRPAYDDTAETSFYVGERFRGRGIGRRLKEAIVAEARRLGLHTLLARVAEGSYASLHLNAQSGFRHVGTMRQVGLKFGRRLDVHLLQLMLGEHAAPPPPRPPRNDGGTIPGFTLAEQLAEAQIRQLHALYQLQWWSLGRSLEDVRSMLDHTSLLLALIDNDSGALAGFCRVLTDFEFLATVYDVMVAPAWQGRGLGRALMDALIEHPRMQRVDAWHLRCKPAMTAFYERWGFTASGGEVMTMVRRL